MKKMRDNLKLRVSNKVGIMLLIFTFIILFPIYADGLVNLELNNKKVMNETEIFLEEGKTYVQAEKIAQLLHFNYYWHENTQTAFLSQVKDGKEYIFFFTNDENNNLTSEEIKLKADNLDKFKDVSGLNLSREEMIKQRSNIINTGFSFDDEIEKVIIPGEFIYNSEDVYVPVRLISDNLTYTLDWDSFSNTIMLRTVNEDELPKRDAIRLEYKEKDLNMMAKLVNIEARDGSVNKKLAVANVILNRVESPRFANTIEGVIFEHGQFPPAHRDSFLNEVPSQDALLACKKALYNQRAELDGKQLTDDVLFFNMVPFPSKSDDEFFGNIEGDYFYY